jgi:[protein-PII] uridylyltransferase
MESISPDNTTGISPSITDLNYDELRIYFQAYLKDRKADILARHRSGLPAKATVAAVTALADGVITALSAAVVRQVTGRGVPLQEKDFALVALGGYGRMELFPYSDIDLMVLYREGANRAVMSYTRGILQLLWDLGFQVGHSARTVQDCLEIGRVDLTTRTALMEARLLYGNTDLFKKFHERFWSRVCNKGIGAYIKAKIQERTDEYTRYGSTVYLLEPDVKKSKGGLRDLNLLKWVAILRYGTTRLEELYKKGLLTLKEYQIGESAQDFLWRVRTELHLHAGRSQDVLSFDEQIRLAQLFSYEDETYLLGVEKFMREYYRHSTTVHEISERFIHRSLPQSGWRRLIQRLTTRQVDELFKLNRYEISIDESRSKEFLETPWLFLKLLHLSQIHGVPISQEAQVMIHEHISHLSQECWSSPAVSRLFMAILIQPGRIADTLKLMHGMNLLERIVPQYEHVHYLMQFNEYHKYTIDEHCIRAVGHAEALVGHSPVAEEELASVYRDIKRKEVLHLALLLHDIGKGREGDHSVIGEEIARNVADRLGLSVEDKALLAFLVRDHLLMAHTAFRRDLSDEGVLLHFARRVAQPEALKMLYVFTYADISAVGPDTWTPWKKDLLTDLFVKTLETLTGTGEVLTQEERSQRIREEIKRQLEKTYPSHWLETQLEAMTPRYLLTTPIGKISDHLKRMGPLQQEKVMVDVEYSPEYRTSEFTVYTFDDLIPGIFSKIAGVMAAKGLQILDAQIHTRKDGVVVDTFQVMDPDYVQRPPERRFEDICQAIRRVLLAEITVDDLFVRSVRYPSGRLLPPRVESTRIEIDNELSDRYTIIDVFAHDRQGLLYVITKAIFELALSVHFAKVATRLDQIVDVFYVTDLEGKKIDKAERLQSIRQTLASKIDEFLMSPQGPTPPKTT